ncbi:hypothetical protein EA795_18030 [Stutzerimonas nitrititolerans]|uniref:Uncharacterized protein n=1 Tax=Stutzerimonas nitrititolerans TaxID=2482751 RepID=A0ABX9UX62_9GAMM|nr:hypothetical protein EA795_18030 [Stutzerimonas nitrititolerans]
MPTEAEHPRGLSERDLGRAHLILLAGPARIRREGAAPMELRCFRGSAALRAKLLLCAPLKAREQVRSHEKRGQPHQPDK